MHCQSNDCFSNYFYYLVISNRLMDGLKSLLDDICKPLAVSVVMGGLFTP